MKKKQNLKGPFVVYLHVERITGKPLYVGCGSGNRPYDTNARSDAWRQAISLNGFTVEILGVYDTRSEALKEERQAIKDLEHYGIVNVRSYHANMTPEAKVAMNAKKSAARKGKDNLANMTPEAKAARAAKISATKKAHSPEAKAAISAKLSARLRSLSPEAKAARASKISATLKAMVPEAKAAVEAKRAATMGAKTLGQRAAIRAKKIATRKANKLNRN